MARTKQTAYANWRFPPAEKKKAVEEDKKQMLLNKQGGLDKKISKTEK